MHPAPRRAALAAALATVLASPESQAVRLDTDGLGQALIFPYYTVQSVNGNPLNTYLSVVNHTSDVKAVRVRFREGRMGAEVLSFNLFLSPNDVWTGAVVPDPISQTAVITTDNSCTDPPFPVDFVPGALPKLEFRNSAYSGVNDDGAGSGLDRTREGYVEMIEMATLTGSAAAGAIHNSAGVPVNCASVRGNANLTAAAPSGGLSGTLTLINVANGMDFDLNATALADLSKRPFFRVAADPYPDFAATEIDGVSSVVTGGILYRSVWARPADAVSAVLMRSTFTGEYVLDNATASNTDFVATFPTRQHYVTKSALSAPFYGAAGWSEQCASGGAGVTTTFHDREEQSGGFPTASDFVSPPPPLPEQFCGAAVVFSVFSNDAHTTEDTTVSSVLGSRNHDHVYPGVQLRGDIQNGWLDTSYLDFALANGLTSQPTSTRIDLATGAQATGSHRYRGLPMVGFWARTFVNGTLTCGAGACQGNYGGAFPFRYTRTIAPATVP